MSLSPTAKLLWLYLLDHCDNSGVVEPNTKLASFQVGEAIKEEHFLELGNRLKTLPNGKILIPKFIEFQFGSLVPESRVHASVLKLLQNHGLPYPIDTLSIGSVKGTGTIKDKDKDKDKEKEPDRKGGTGGNGKPSRNLRLELMSAYRRQEDSRLTYIEESSLAEIVRERPRYFEEWDMILTLKKNEPRFFPQSLSKLLTNWQETLDRANSWVPEVKPVKSLIEKVLDEIP